MLDGIPLAGSVFHVLFTHVWRTRERQPARHTPGALRSVGAGAGDTVPALGRRLRVLRAATP
eukprot:3265130-Rhodomonas_salina.2